MAFDVYVGTMSRFYSRNWENAVQRTAREQGIPYHQIRTNNEELPNADQVRTFVRQWCDELTEHLQPHGVGPVSWDEQDSLPYFTGRPGWDGYGGLLLWAAYAGQKELPIPERLPENWSDDQVYLSALDPETQTPFPDIVVPELWLPVEFPFIFQVPRLTGDQVRVGSVFTLKKDLDELHRQLKSNDETPRPAAPGGATDKKNKASPEQSREVDSMDEQPSLVELAEIGLSIFRDLAAHACELRLPLMLDY